MKKKFEELYEIDKIKNYVDETPAGIMISQVEKYTKNQMVILHGVPDPLPRRQDLLTLYNKAVELQDENALVILVNKYNIDRLLFDDELPDISDDETELTMQDIDSFIQKINPHIGRDKLKARENMRTKNARYVKYMDYSGKVPILNARTYLKDVPRHSLEAAVYHFSIPGYKKMTDEELIEVILKHSKCKDIIINNIKKRHGVYFKHYVVEYIENGDYLINTK